MSSIAPGWYPDPADRSTQRYWDGEGWVGDPLPADATPPPGPPEPAAATALAAQAVAVPVVSAPPAPAITSPAVEGVLVPGGPDEPATFRQYPYVLVPPAPRPHGHPLAGYGARLVARSIDFAAVFGLNLLINGWFVFKYWQLNLPYYREFYRRAIARESTEGLQPPAEVGPLTIVILVLAAAIWLAYEVPALANTGQTLGKRMAGIKVVRLDSPEPLGFGRSLRRWNTIGLPTLLWSCGLGFILQFVDCLWVLVDRPLRQSLHDKSAGTVVVAVGTPTRPLGGSDVPADPR